MRDLDEIRFIAFREELKTAALRPLLHDAISGAGALGGIGALAGGLAGGYRSFRQAREQGAGTAEALVGSLGGVGRGAAFGGGLGAATGAIGGGVSPGLGERLTKLPGLGAPARLGQRQVHALTGWTPRDGIESIRGGAYDAKATLDRLRASSKTPPAALARAEKAEQAARAAQEAGLTSIPGYIQALRKDPVGALKKGLGEQWHGSSTATKALTVGVPMIEAANATLGKEDPEGPGRAERVGRGLLPAAAGMVSGQLPFAGQLLVGGAAGALGGRAGRLVDRLRGRVPPPYKPEPPMGPIEVRATPEAMVGPTAGSGGGEL